MTSRKVVSLKSFSQPGRISFGKEQIKKLFGDQIRPATIFRNPIPFKAYCYCWVGVSGLCCHTPALLLFPKHYAETKKKFLALSCTMQLQKWHRGSKKGSLPMMPLHEIKVKLVHFIKSLVQLLQLALKKVHLSLRFYRWKLMLP